jgi:hypothetical protein
VDDEQKPSEENLEQERQRKEAEELANFERRANWWRQHYGDVNPDEAAQRAREAAEHADRMPPEPPSKPAE